jgi:hypothetical protein
MTVSAPGTKPAAHALVMETVFEPAFDPTFAPIIDLRTRDSETVPVVMLVTFSQPGMAPASVSVVIDNELPGDTNFGRNVAAAGDIFRGLVYGIYGVRMQPTTEEELLGYRTGLITAGAHRLEE